MEGFHSARSKLTLVSGRTERITLSMSVSAVAETVTVTGESPVINAQMARLAEGVGVAGGIAAGMPAGLIGGVHDRQTGRFNTEAYDHIDENPFRRVPDEPLSTFSIDIDTASYPNVRRFLTDGDLPPRERGPYPGADQLFPLRLPAAGGDPVRDHHRAGRGAVEPEHRLALVGLRGRERTKKTSRAAQPGVPARRLWLDGAAREAAAGAQRDAHAGRCARPQRSLAIVVYAGRQRTRVAGHAGTSKAAIHDAHRAPGGGRIDQRRRGPQLAYRGRPGENFIPGGVNRVILCDRRRLQRRPHEPERAGASSSRQERKSGVFLSVLGVGIGNLKDSTMEPLADKGNGNYAYLDSLQEARKVLVRRSWRHAGDDREGREDPGGVQSAPPSPRTG